MLITEQLGLAGTKVASHSSTEESFQSLMEMSSRARSLYPFSSEYVAAGLDRVRAQHAFMHARMFRHAVAFAGATLEWVTV